MQPTKTAPNLFGDNIGTVAMWDFSEANMSDASRVQVVTQVASICYGDNPKTIGSEHLYDKLAAESLGLPSSAFEFVPVLYPLAYFGTPTLADIMSMHVFKYGTLVGDYLLTNLRAVIHDGLDVAHYNTPAECAIIKQHTRFYRAEVDLNTRSQLVRHRSGSFQELSRRYVGERVPFEFYIPDNMPLQPIVKHTYQKQIQLYRLLVSNKVPKEAARRVLPQAMYTGIWFGWIGLSGFENFIKLRTDQHAQIEIRTMAKQIQEWG